MAKTPIAFGDDGRYVVKRSLGAGSYADTYLAEHSGSPVAVKWLRIDSEEGGRQRFANEAWALGQLDHDAIPKLVETGKQEGRPYIVMTYAQGLDLRKVAARTKADGGTVAQKTVIGIATAVLDALAHMHGRGISHRDVKDANVIFDEADGTVMLVDLGMCKAASQPEDADTFWNAGASKFSPPSKLQYPSKVRPNHDVFAVGVLGYLLLTNRFPWDAGPDGDRGMLEDQMRSVRPADIHELNSVVDREVSRVFMSLLDTNDNRRPEASAAHRRLTELASRPQADRAGAAGAAMRALKCPRVVRDPLHGDVALTDDEWELLNTPEFQRLRWLRQLGTSNLVYPGAEHTRLAHSIGAMHVASTILRRIEERSGTRFDVDELITARTLALLHDVSHVPFGHALEDEMALLGRHDRNAERLGRLLSPKNPLGKRLSASPHGRVVLGCLHGSKSPEVQWLTELIDAPSGADVLDYIDRDAYHCGLDHRIDSAVYRRFSVERSPIEQGRGHFRSLLFGHHGFRLDADFALETILRERFALFLKVYTHPVKVAAGAMIGKAVWSLMKRGRTRTLSEREFEWMGDNDLLSYLKASQRPLAKRLAEMVLRRSLWKPAFQARALRPTELSERQYDARRNEFDAKGLLDPERRAELEAKIAGKAKRARDEVIVYCPPNAPGLQKIRQYVAIGPGSEEVREAVHEPHLRIRSAHIGLWMVFVFVPPHLGQNDASAVAEATEEVLGLKNDIGSFQRRQLMLEF